MTTSEDNKIKSTGFRIRKQINKTLEQRNPRGFFLKFIGYREFLSKFHSKRYSALKTYDKLKGTTLEKQTYHGIKMNYTITQRAA